jgi:hypothetical protein
MFEHKADQACPALAPIDALPGFTGRDGLGYASLRYDACRRGIAVSRVSIQDGATVLVPDLSAAVSCRTSEWRDPGVHFLTV